MDCVGYLLAHPWLDVLLLYAVMSLVAFVLYWRDKRAAQAGRWRTPEATLHLVELLCGWPGALLAQRKLHHKCSKVSYQIVFWLIVVMNIVSMLWLVMR